MKYTLYKKSRTPSGYWDNGLYETSTKTVTIGKKAMELAVISEVTIPLVHSGKADALKIDISGTSYVVEKV